MDGCVFDLLPLRCFHLNPRPSDIILGDWLGALMQIRGATTLSLPIIVSEQYPKALGSTCTELMEVRHHILVNTHAGVSGLMASLGISPAFMIYCCVLA